MDLKIKSATFAGMAIGAGMAALIAHTSDMSPAVWLLYGMAAGWAGRSVRDI